MIHHILTTLITTQIELHSIGVVRKLAQHINGSRLSLKAFSSTSVSRILRNLDSFIIALIHPLSNKQKRLIAREKFYHVGVKLVKICFVSITGLATPTSPSR